jgi:hypothetical protein
MGSKIFIGVAIAVIAGVILIFANIMANEHAEVSYQLQGADSLYLSFHSPLEVTLNEGNDGNIGATTISTISILNATITQVSIPSVAQQDLYNYCQFNDTVATISNLTVVKGSSLSKWATIYVTPNEGVSSFQISVHVELSSDWSHPRSTVMRTLPTELIYNLTSTDLYELLK